MTERPTRLRSRALFRGVAPLSLPLRVAALWLGWKRRAGADHGPLGRDGRAP